MGFIPGKAGRGNKFKNWRRAMPEAAGKRCVSNMERHSLNKKLLVLEVT